jgi:hypothetical protein
MKSGPANRRHELKNTNNAFHLIREMGLRGRQALNLETAFIPETSASVFRVYGSLTQKAIF